MAKVTELPLAEVAPLGSDELVMVQNGEVVRVSLFALSAYLANPVAPPAFLEDPSLVGETELGVTLVVDDGTFTGGTVSQRQVQRSTVPGVWEDIAGATGSTYTQVEADVDAELRVRVRLAGEGGTAEAYSAAVGPVTIAAPFSTVLADGWRVQAASNIVGQAYNVLRTGFDENGAATTFLETATIGTRVRNLVPNQATFSSTDHAAAEYIFADDVVPGATNNSTEVSPTPIARTIYPSRLVFGNTGHWELCAFHMAAHLGREVASVWTRATDGTNSTNWQIVFTPTLSTSVEDAWPTAVYQGDHDLSALPDEAEYYWQHRVFPHVGVTASILETAASNDLRLFGRRWFTKDVDLAANPPKATVDPATGNDTTGVISTTLATADATPCATVQGAINRAAATLPSGKVDWLHIYVKGTVPFGTSAATSRNQKSGAVVITRHPTTTRSAAIVQQSNAQNFRLGLGGFLDARLTWGALVFKDVTVQRTGAGQIANGGSPQLHVQLWNCAVDNGGVIGAWGGTGSAISQFGAVWTNVSTSTFSFNANQTQYMLRGVVADINSGYEGGCVIGSTLTRAGGPGYADAQNGAVWYNSAFLNPSSANAPIAISTASAGQTINGTAIVQVFVEPTHTNSGTPAIRPSSDTTNGNLNHVVIHHVVCLGDGLLARMNLAYDDTVATPRTHKFVSVVGYVGPQMNIKGDVNAANVGIANPALRVGNRALIHGVGCAGNFTKRAVNNVGSEAQVYAGPGSNIGTSTTVLNNPLFVDDRGTTFTAPSTYTAGAGGSNVRLQSGSPAKGIVPRRVLSHDFAGDPRTGTTQDAGIYA